MIGTRFYAKHRTTVYGRENKWVGKHTAGGLATHPWDTVAEKRLTPICLCIHKNLSMVKRLWIGINNLASLALAPLRLSFFPIFTFFLRVFTLF